jgi:hypothetical protein
VQHVWERRDMHTIFARKSEEHRSREDLGVDGKITLQLLLKNYNRKNLDWIHHAENRPTGWLL